MNTKQQKREAGSLPYDILHAHVQQRHLIITSTCKDIAHLVVKQDRLLSRYLVSESEHKYRRN